MVIMLYRMVLRKLTIHSLPFPAGEINSNNGGFWAFFNVFFMYYPKNRTEHAVENGTERKQ